MRMGDESQQVLEWAYGRLTASQALADALSAATGLDVPLEAVEGHVWPDEAPGDVEGAWIILATNMPTTDRLALGSYPRLSTQVPLDVRAVMPTAAYSRLAPVARAIYDTLHGRTNDPVGDGGMILQARRTGGIQYPERADGIAYRHLGHTFQVEVN